MTSLELCGIVEGCEYHLIAACGGYNTCVTIVQHRVDHGPGIGVGFALILTEGYHCLSKGAHMAEAIARGRHGDLAILQPSHTGPAEIVMYTHGVAHDNLRGTNQFDFHRHSPFE